MSKSFIYTVNSSVQTVAADGIVNPGTVVRRFGPNLARNGNGVEARGTGYYSMEALVVCAPAAAGPITATLLKDGVPIPGATATVTAAAANDVVTIPVLGAIREMGCGCCAGGASAITCQLSAEADVQNYVFRAEKE